MTKAFAPAAERNQRPILDVLRRTLPSDGLVLEIASGTGQHASFFSEHLSRIRWQPSDASREALESIRARVREARRDNLLPPVELDVRTNPWPRVEADAILCINMIHIAPWEATAALFGGASKILEEAQPLITYGPYRLHGTHTSQSNAAFDQTLRARNPEWGVRDVDDLRELGKQTGFELVERVAMPANNMTLIWTRSPRPAATTAE
ncbi:MAG: class I SAM-dependent methyltransferase [Myxococcales bacterium]|nr:class I SAM-dependent methyltransferase [Myxococcales bacterium]MDH3842584.1 class I SAM-dependent methyltransferase [Myxococcales bacterium]